MFILASQSPRRKEILEMLGVDFTIIPAKNEAEIPSNMPIKYGVTQVAYLKAREVFHLHPESTVLGADTVVVIGNEILGKPKDKQEAYSMLKKLSGKTHQVMTGVALIKKGKTVMFSEQARVTFASLTDEEINDYIETGEPFDKAGSYAVQGKSAKFVKKIDGDYYAVVGLPCQKLYQALKNF